MTLHAEAYPSTRPQAATRLVPLGFFWLICAAELFAIYALTDGRLVYSLDDAYIHLAVAESLVRGTYGVNPGEFSAPCSSILWPFLLVPFQLTALASLAPLLINLGAGSMTVVLFERTLRNSFRPQTPHGAWWVAAGASVLILSSNVIPLVFMGMEHSLQVLSVVTILYGAMREREDGRLPRLCLVALTAAPWIRYESVVVCVAFAGYFWARGHRREVSVCALVSLTIVFAFSVYLWANGAGLLPGSVVAKAVPVAPDLAGMIQARIVTAARAVEEHPQAIVLGVFMFGFAVCSVVLQERAMRWIAAALAAAGVGHLLIGQFGVLARYESYIWTLAVLGLTWLLAEPLRRNVTPATFTRLAVLAASGLLLASASFVSKVFQTPFGARDIYRQQLQMHHLAAELYKQPVAVNDLGWVAYRNDAYVLDLVGLASKEALHGKRTQQGSAWIQALTRKHGVGLVMIYRDWFPSLPAGWVELGTLSMPERTSAASNEVAFFATTPRAAAELRPLLAAFARTLPHDVAFAASAAALGESSRLLPD
jgi:hypothetical protein